MPAGTYDLYIEQGATFNVQITLTDGDDTFSLVGYNIRSQIRKANCQTPSISLTTTAVSLAAGVFTISLTATQTAALDFTDGAWDLEIEQGGEVRRILQGNVTINPEVTTS